MIFVTPAKALLPVIVDTTEVVPTADRLSVCGGEIYCSLALSLLFRAKPSTYK